MNSVSNVGHGLGGLCLGASQAKKSSLSPLVVVDVDSNENETQLNAKKHLMQQFTHHSNSLAVALGTCSMPITPSCLLGTFEESLLNGRLNPVGLVDGFYADIGASGAFFPPHQTLPVNASFYQVCEDVAASPYLVSSLLIEIMTLSLFIVVIILKLKGRHRFGFAGQTRLQSTNKRNDPSGKSRC